jgi:hypothetical protein
MCISILFLELLEFEEFGNFSIFFFSSLVADNQTSDDHQQTAALPTKKNLSSINSFEEWKQQQLQADLLSLFIQ